MHSTMGAPELPQEDQSSLDEAISISMPALEAEGISDADDSDGEFVGDEYSGYQPLAADEVTNHESNDDENESEPRRPVGRASLYSLYHS